MTWKYLLQVQTLLQKRENGNIDPAKWYGYTRNQALDVISLPKVFTPDIASHASYSHDSKGDVFFTGGVAGGYGILPNDQMDVNYMMGLLNSKLLDWIVRQTSTQMRGGYYSFESRFIKHLPIRTIDFNDGADKKRHDQMVKYVETMLALHKKRACARTPDDRTQIENQIAATDRLVDKLVYELYGLTEEEIGLVENRAI